MAPYAADVRPQELRRQSVGEPRSTIAAILFNVLDPIPYGFFFAALVFDAVYADSAQVLWFKSAAWLIALGLVVAILPRFINLAHVWFPRSRQRLVGEMAGFWLNLFAIVVAIWNAFVHSRDAYGVMPEGLWLSILTMVLLVLAKVVPTLQLSNRRAVS